MAVQELRFAADQFTSQISPRRLVPEQVPRLAPTRQMLEVAIVPCKLLNGNTVGYQEVSFGSEDSIFATGFLIEAMCETDASDHASTT